MSLLRQGLGPDAQVYGLAVNATLNMPIDLATIMPMVRTLTDKRLKLFLTGLSKNVLGNEV
eukprot:5654320-Heterocapsa_arctica.AAC.1